MISTARVDRQNFITAAWVEWRRRCIDVPPFAEQLVMLRTLGELYDAGVRTSVSFIVDAAIARTIRRAA